jgi:enhancing lycopene biosynthesis protein 2
MKKIAVVLAGCGVFDGAEIHEAVLTMLAIKKSGAEYSVFAPDKDQHHVMNHFTHKESNEKRNVLVESARIARGRIRPLDDFKSSDFDALVFPGGFGVAKNLCTFAFDGAECVVDKSVERAIQAMLAAHKPIGAMCISPVILAKLIGNDVTLTIGSDTATASAVTTMKAKHINTGHGDVVVDEKYKVVTTPCYMLDASIVDIQQGTEKLVEKLLKMCLA